jgi:hypothetical protein
MTRVVQRATLILRLRPEPGTDPDKAIRGLLKMALRRFGLRCIGLEREDPPKD